MERIQKVIAASGVCSRRRAEELIKEGKVSVNGNIIRELGVKVDNKDIISVNGEIISKEEKVYYLLNKPRGVISSVSDDKNRTTVVDLIDTDKRIFPVGRLDYDTTGVLLLTNDGEFSNILMHPSTNIDKVYLVKLEGIIKKEGIDSLKKGILLDGKIVKASKVKLKKYDLDKNISFVEITIHEGINHQVKRMFESIGFKVEKLNRKRVGIFNLEGLKSGEYRKLTLKEIQIIYSYKNKQ